MKNHGLRELVIVSSDRPDMEAASPLAVHASDLLENARVVPDLRTATVGCTLVAGVTRRTGQKRKNVTFSARQFASLPAVVGAGQVAVVFGNEQSGLSDDELHECAMAVFIPSDPLCPSLNLSHAVQVVAYELFVATAPNGVRSPHEPLAAAALRHSVDRIIGSLDALGYHSQDGPQGLGAFLRELLGRAALMPREASRLEHLFETLEGMHGRK